MVAYMENNQGSLTNPDDLRRSIAYFGQRRQTFLQKVDEETASLRSRVWLAVEVHGMSELEVSKLAGVTRDTVRRWLGK